MDCRQACKCRCQLLMMKCGGAYQVAHWCNAAFKQSEALPHYCCLPMKQIIWRIWPCQQQTLYCEGQLPVVHTPEDHKMRPGPLRELTPNCHAHRHYMTLEGLSGGLLAPTIAQDRSQAETRKQVHRQAKQLPDVPSGYVWKPSAISLTKMVAMNHNLRNLLS